MVLMKYYVKVLILNLHIFVLWIIIVLGISFGVSIVTLILTMFCHQIEHSESLLNQKCSELSICRYNKNVLTFSEARR